MIEQSQLKNFDLRPEQVLPNTRFMHANGSGWLESARRTVARSYHETLSPELDIYSIYDQLCIDGYDENGRSRTYVAITNNPLTSQDEVSATLRLVLGKSQDEEFLAPIDALNLIEASWPHREQGMSDTQVAELGRFGVESKYRTLAMHRCHVVSSLTGGLVRIALQDAVDQGKQYVYAIMPSYVTRLVNQAGIPIDQVEGMRLREEEPTAHELFDRYPRYWRPSAESVDKGPKLYTISLPK